MVIFIIDMMTYTTFVVCTIGQITNFLDIYCLSIKHKDPNAVNENSSSARVAGIPDAGIAAYVKQREEKIRKRQQEKAEEEKKKPENRA